MGRQVHIAATPVDEAAFLDFLRKTADIALIEHFAPTIDALWVSSFDPTLSNHWSYSIWNKYFSWTPQYGQVGEQAYHHEHVGWYFIAKLNTAPIIEFDRSDVHQQRYGRLYWAKDVAAPHGLEYDVHAFARWYDAIVRWIRKHGKKLTAGAYQPYFLPDAWEQHHRRHG